jgi:hypothetical protein
VVLGCRTGRWEAAGGGGSAPIGRVDTTVPGQRRHPPRPCLDRAERGNPVVVRTGKIMSGSPTVRKDQLPGGYRVLKKRMPAAETQRECQTRQTTSPWGRVGEPAGYQAVCLGTKVR